MKLKYAYGAASGISGGGQETGYQGKAGLVEKNGAAVISPASEAVAALVAVRFDELYFSEEDLIRRELLGNMSELLFVAVKENRYLAGHMGGGLIAKWNGSPSVLSKPEPEGLALSEADPEVSAMANLRIYKGELQEPFGFMMISEGACRSLYNSGTAVLSPACGTFFEWLREYDEETVSEAFTDNINKYFLKDVTGDISVAVMVSDENDTEAEEGTEAEEPSPEGGGILPEGRGEPGEMLPEDEGQHGAALIENDEGRGGKEPEGASGKRGRILKYLLALLIILAAVSVCILVRPDGNAGKEPKGADQAEPGNSAAQSESFENYEPSVTFAVENPKSYDAGEYKAGVDIPAGEYFFWTGEMLEPGSIKVNGDSCLSGELYCMTVQLNEWDTLVSDYRFTAAENISPIKATGGVLISGKYKIGKDVAPGTYQIAPSDQGGEGRYYSIFDEEISNDTKFSGETTVEVPEEGYIVFYNAVLSVGS